MAADGRSFLYVPGHRESRIHGALSSAADAVVIDLEDGVPAAEKAAARETARAVLATDPAGPTWVRIATVADVSAVVSPALTGIWVPKAEPALLAEVDAALTAAEQARGVAVGRTAVVALVETALGVLRAEEVCRAPRVVRLGVGEADLAGELRLRPDPLRTELYGIRLQLVLASAAAGLGAPIGPVETNLTDENLLAESTTTLLRQGFRARTALHPKQLPTINAVFTPSASEVAEAREMLTTYTSAGGAVDRHGRFVDPAVLRTARETLDRAALAHH